MNDIRGEQLFESPAWETLAKYDPKSTVRQGDLLGSKC